MQEITPSPKYTAADLEIRELIFYIRKRKWRYLAIVMILGVYFFYIFKYKILEYSATATFLVNENSVLSTTLGGENISSGENYIRLYELINSAPVQKHLIEKFDLIRHYGIDTTKEFYYQKAIATIRSKIQVSKNPFNSISITIRDSYRYLPADIANEIVSYIEKLNQDYYIKNIENKVRFSQSYVKQLEIDNSIKSANIDSLIKKLNIIITTGHLNERNIYEFLQQQQKLSELIGIFKNSSNELINSQKLYNLSLQALNFQSFPTITTLQVAMPAFRSIVYKAAMYTILAMIAVFMLLILQGYFYMHNKEHIRLLLTGN